MRWWLLVIDVLVSTAVSAQSPVERLTIETADGVLVAEREGSEAHVPFDPTIEEMLSRPGADLTLTHTHPNSTSFSMVDLGLLSKAGLSRLVVIAADGSRYEATRGAAYDAGRFENLQYSAAHDEVTRMVHQARTARGEPRAFEEHVAHLTAVALGKAGVIVYRATLGGVRLRMWEKDAALFGAVIDSAAHQVPHGAVPGRDVR